MTLLTYIVSLKFLNDPREDNFLYKLLSLVFYKKEIAELIKTCHEFWIKNNLLFIYKLIYSILLDFLE